MDIANCRTCGGKGYRDVGEGLSLCQGCAGLCRIPHRCVFCGGKGLVKKR